MNYEIPDRGGHIKVDIIFAIDEDSEDWLKLEIYMNICQFQSFEIRIIAVIRKNVKHHLHLWGKLSVFSR